MRRSSTRAYALGLLTAVSLTAVFLTGCAPAHRAATGAPTSAPLSSAELTRRLLNESDLGEGYIRKSETAPRHDDVTVIGCPALERLGSNAATGSGPDFPRKAKASFTHTGSTGGFEVDEELYSDSAENLSKRIGTVFDAMLTCPSYQVTSGRSVINMRTERTAAPGLGDEQWSRLLTSSAGGQRTVVKQTAIRTGTVLLIVSGTPALVDAHLDEALAKAQTASPARQPAGPTLPARFTTSPRTSCARSSRRGGNTGGLLPRGGRCGGADGVGAGSGRCGGHALGQLP